MESVPSTSWSRRCWSSRLACSKSASARLPSVRSFEFAQLIAKDGQIGLPPTGSGGVRSPAKPEWRQQKGGDDDDEQRREYGKKGHGLRVSLRRASARRASSAVNGASSVTRRLRWPR